MGKNEANRVDHHGHTPLMHAARAGSGDTVRVLLALGADTKAVDAKGLTALHHAACCENEEIGALSALLGAGGVDVNAVTTAGSTALDAANGWTEAETLLRSAGGESRAPWTGDDDDDDGEGNGDGSDGDGGGGNDDEASTLPAAAAAAAATASAIARKRKNKGGKAAQESASGETEPATKLSWTQWGLVAAVIASLLLPMLGPLLSYFEGPPNLFAEVSCSCPLRAFASLSVSSSSSSSSSLSLLSSSCVLSIYLYLSFSFKRSLRVSTYLTRTHSTKHHPVTHTVTSFPVFLMFTDSRLILTATGASLNRSLSRGISACRAKRSWTGMAWRSGSAATSTRMDSSGDSIWDCVHCLMCGIVFPA